jgi:uncharacterized protein YqhQ
MMLKKHFGFILFLIFLETLSFFLVDYYSDPIGVIVFIHLLPLVLIWLLVKFG